MVSINFNIVNYIIIYGITNFNLVIYDFINVIIIIINDRFSFDYGIINFVSVKF